MKGFKKEVDKYLTIENVFWIFLILLPFILKDSVIKESVQVHYFDYFKPIPFLVLIGVIFILCYIKSNLKTKMFIYKWFFPVCLWINLYMPKEGNGTFVIIFIDILFCVLILWTTFDILKPDSYNSELNHGLISDDPIESNEENDSFNRRDYAQSIVSEIRKTVNKRAFNIALTGAWGSGKTSFLNLIKGEMDKEIDNEKIKFITVKYNPWDFKEDKIIGLDLLKTISHELANEKELQEKFKGLMMSLQSVDESPWYKVIPNLLIGFSSEKSINEYREEIGKALQDQDKKLVIFLDDLDRLDGDEILEVFKTIRNSFDIANTFFILGFDIEYAADQIKEKVKGERALEYLDKIFQMRLFMPSNSDYSYYKEYKALVKSHFDIEIKADIDWTFPIDSKRILFQLINSLKVFFNKENIQDYNIKALMQIEYLKIVDPVFYDFIIKSPDSILNKYNSIGYTTVMRGNNNINIETFDNYVDTFATKINSKSLLNNFFKNLDTKTEYKINAEEFQKYFKYSLHEKEFSTAILDDAVTNENRVTLDNHITENNKNSLIKKIDEMLSKNQNDWLKTTFIELLYKDQNNLWLYNNKYKIYDYDTYPSFEDLKTKIETFEIKDKINFLADLKNKNAAVNQYLIDLYSVYFKKEIDDYFWKVYHSTKDSKAENRTEFKDKFIEIIRDTISENFLNVIKNSVSYTPEGGSRTSVNRSDPDYYYLVGLFSPQDWLSFIPMDKHKETPYSDIRNWLENLDANNCGELNYTHVFGKDYFDRFSTLVESKLEEE